jgi:hypothetical protein
MAARTTASTQGSRVTSSPSETTPVSAVSRRVTSRGPRVSARCPNGTWHTIPASAAADSASPTCVGSIPTTRVK